MTLGIWTSGTRCLSSTFRVPSQLLPHGQMCQGTVAEGNPVPFSPQAGLLPLSLWHPLHMAFEVAPSLRLSPLFLRLWLFVGYSFTLFSHIYLLFLFLFF